MRLWQKIYLITLFLSLAAIHILPTAVLVRNQRDSLKLASEEARQAASSAAREIGNGIDKMKIQKGRAFLTDNETREYLAAAGESLRQNGREVSVSRTAQPTAEDEVSRTALAGQGDSRYIKVTIPVFLEGSVYQVKYETDVTEMFAGFTRERNFIRAAGIITALIMAGVLLAVIVWLTRPLKKLELATERIAEGRYQERVAVRGHDEIAELAGHLNEMARRIEEHVGQTSRLAESRRVFIANMTHELKTPLTSILGFADILKIKGSVSDEERREYAAIIGAEAGRLRGLSSKLMELITLEENALELRPVDLGRLLVKVVESFRPACEERNLRISHKVESVAVDMDEELFTSLLYNILDNACKASAKGQTIRLEARKKGRDAVIQIRDQGMGIPKDQLEFVTEAFYMVDKSRSRKAGGAGIGLALCKTIAEAHHGELVIESEAGRGTCVTLTFPVSEGRVKD